MQSVAGLVRQPTSNGQEAGLALAESMFRLYDIRGDTQTDLTDDAAYRIGQAYVQLWHERKGPGVPTVAVGRDVRPTSHALQQALADGVMSLGGTVLDIGVVPTPVLYYALFTTAVDGGIMITGSHNPARYNGMKIAMGHDMVWGPELQRLAQLAQGCPAPAGKTGMTSTHAVLPRYVEDLAQRFGAGTLGAPGRPSLRVVVDCGNGCAGLVMPALLDRLGIECSFLYVEPDGTFPNHHPDPTIPATLEGLRDKVQSGHADFGIAFDGDVDRIGVVDEQGRVVWGDKLTYLYAADIIGHMASGAEPVRVIGEVKCSKALFDGVEQLGGIAVMSATGHSIIKQVMRDQHAQLAGEMSGHIFFADRYYGYDDAIYAALRLMELFVDRRSTSPGLVFSDLLRDLPTMVTSPEIRRPCLDEQKVGLVAGFMSAFRSLYSDLAQQAVKVVNIDGVRIEWVDGWGLVRASNTEPLLVLRFEAETETRMLDIQTAFEKTLSSQAVTNGGRR
jgi:phosphomannomutase/phosphoglucomutase